MSCALLFACCLPAEHMHKSAEQAHTKLDTSLLLCLYLCLCCCYVCCLPAEHMHKSAEQVHTKLDSKLLQQLLEMEQQQKVNEFKSRMQKETAASKADAEAGSSENWQALMNSAPWLEQQQGLEQQQQQQQQESSRY
jgi:apolipoprotein N-acyltransferase